MPCPARQHGTVWTGGGLPGRSGISTKGRRVAGDWTRKVLLAHALGVTRPKFYTVSHEVVGRTGARPFRELVRGPFLSLWVEGLHGAPT